MCGCLSANVSYNIHQQRNPLLSSWQQAGDQRPPSPAYSLLQMSVANKSVNTLGRVVTWGAVTANGADVFWNPAGARWLIVDVSQVLQTRRRLYVFWAVHRIHLRTTGRRRRQNLSRVWPGPQHYWAREEAERKREWSISWHSPFLSFRLPLLCSSLPSHALQPSQCAITCSGSGSGSEWGLSYRFF